MSQLAADGPILRAAAGPLAARAQQAAMPIVGLVTKADADDLDDEIAALAARGARGLILTADGVFHAHRAALVATAIKHTGNFYFPATSPTDC